MSLITSGRWSIVHVALEDLNDVVAIVTLRL
jgi:hypothetical protein